MYHLKITTKFKKDFKLCEKRGYDLDLFDKVLDIIIIPEKLSSNFKQHQLKGNYANHWECHIKPDWLLIWFQDDENKEITLVRIGTHSDLF
jgi:mRNA interferase YafQ